MGFKDILKEDIQKAFLNEEEFAERLSVRYDGRIFHDVKIINSAAKESGRNPESGDRAQGLFAVTRTVYMALSDFDGVLPEVGQRIYIEEKTPWNSFFKPYKVAQSVVEAGLAVVDVRAIDE